jgi:Ferritin-like domain
VDELSFDRLDVDGALAESAERVGLTRSDFLAVALGGSGALLGGIAARPAEARAQELPSNDIFILNYALVLEFLQAAFYTEAERMGALSGGTARAAEVVGGVERAHVQAFKSVLGSKAVKRPSFDFQGTTEDPRAFLKTAVAFEDLAVAAYKGQATRIEANPALASALAIHSVEARHAAWMRYLFDVDPAPTAFDEPQTRSEVTRLVRSTNFITGAPSTDASEVPRYTG